MDEVVHVHLPLFQPKPTTRGDCLSGGVNAVRPCHWNTCKYHMSTEDQSCVLDVADQGGVTLEEVGKLMGLTRERIRQIEEKTVRKLYRLFPEWKP